MHDQTKFVFISRKFLECRKYLSPQATCVWIELVSYWFLKEGSLTERTHDYVKPSIKTISNFTGVSENVVRKTFKELKILGFITKIVAEKNPDGSNKPNVYYLDENPKNIIEKLPELEKFQNKRRSKNTIKEDGWGE